jgi:hypothetical protein
MIHEISDVIAGGEVIACTGQDDNSHAKVTGRLIEGAGEVCVHIPGEGIHLFGAIERDGQDGR